MPAKKVRNPSPLQRNILIVLAALDTRSPGPVATRNIERMLEMGGNARVYGTNLRASCRRMEGTGWLRTLRAPNQQVAVELTDAGREIATPLLIAEQERIRAERRATEVVVLPLAGTPPADGSELTGDERPVQLADVGYRACRADFVLRLDGTTCLQLWDVDGRLTRLEGDPLQVASWLQTTHDAGIAVGVQINESPVPETHLQPPTGRARKEVKE